MRPKQTGHSWQLVRPKQTGYPWKLVRQDKSVTTWVNLNWYFMGTHQATQIIGDPIQFVKEDKHTAHEYYGLIQTDQQ